MKKIMSLFFIVCTCAMIFGGRTIVCASKACTPAGIEYDKIGEELDQYVQKYES